MILQPMLKVSVSNTVVYTSSTSIGPDLVWREPRPPTVALSAQVRMELISGKISLSVNEEILSSHHSFRGPSLYSRPVP